MLWNSAHRFLHSDLPSARGVAHLWSGSAQSLCLSKQQDLSTKFASSPWMKTYARSKRVVYLLPSPEMSEENHRDGPEYAGRVVHPSPIGKEGNAKNMERHI